MGADEPFTQQPRVGENAYRHPRRGVAARLINAFANSSTWARVRRRLLSKLPFVVLESDVSHVVYMSWCIPLAGVRPLIPSGISVLERDGYTILTLLSYRHGHFGPACMGKARKFFPSPLQSNWRLYASHIHGKPVQHNTVVFLKNIFNNTLYALGSRLFSDVLPSHLAADFQHEHLDGHYSTRIRSGLGGAPEFESHLFPSRENTNQLPELSPEFKRFFDNWQEAVKALMIQDEAVCRIDSNNSFARAGIQLPADLESVQPLVVQRVMLGQYLKDLGVNGPPLCFALPSVKFKVLWEKVEGQP